jgi:hypothetical protein
VRWAHIILPGNMVSPVSGFIVTGFARSRGLVRRAQRATSGSGALSEFGGVLNLTPAPYVEQEKRFSLREINVTTSRYSIGRPEW